MSERDEYEPGVPCWVEAIQPDAAAGVAFYGTLFGWASQGSGGDPAGEYFVARLRGRDVAGVAPLPPDGASPTPAWYTHICVRSADETAEQARSAGGRVLAEPFDAHPAGRIAVLADPTGAVFCVWEPEARKGAQLVNEPGAWSMSQLNTRDPAAAEAFYAAVFGWTTETFDLGQTAITMFRLPGFVGGEPSQPVSREVVATMSPMSPDQFPDDASARWSVDFWVDDVEAIAETAAKLGGTVVAPPFDIQIGTSAVLADPQGVVFSVSKISATR